MSVAPLLLQSATQSDATVTFYEHISPILKSHCSPCHAPGEIAPMSFHSYAEVRPWAAAIRESVKLRRMPPWFADPAHGQFANDPRLTDEQIQLIDRWASNGAPPGDPKKQPVIKPDETTKPFSADLSLVVPTPIPIPANTTIDYQYVILPLPFTYDRWVQGAELRPSDRSVVHHAVVYIREPQSQWLRQVPVGVPWSPTTSESLAASRSTQDDILLVYAPGSPAVLFPDDMAKKIPAGSDLVVQLHYTSKKSPTVDQPSIGLRFSNGRPKRRILTLQMGRDDLRIPPGDANYKASVSGTVPQDALLISMFPHMHLRGAAFDFDLLGPQGYMETLLKVKPKNFNWQLNYVLKQPRVIKQGMVLRWTGYFDNSPNNPLNPDPAAEVTWGEQSWNEMMIGFFDVAVDPGEDKKRYFVR